MTDRFGETSGELSNRDKNFDYMAKNATSSAQVQREASNTGSKYNISFSLQANLPIKEENKQSSLEQATDIFAGFRSWWQDNITNQRLLSGFTAVTDMEITNPPSNKRAGSYHRERAGTHQTVLKNVTELTRHNLAKPSKLDLNFKQQDALSLVG